MVAGSGTGANSGSRGSKDVAKRLYQEEKYSEAIREFGKLIDAADTNDSNTEIHIFYSNRSAAYMQMGDVSNALDDAEQCKRLKPTWSKGYSRCGSALIAQGKYRDAVYALEKAQELDPSSTGAALLAQARSRAGMGPSPSSGGGGGPGMNSGGLDFGGIAGNALAQGRVLLSRALGLFATLSQEYRMAAGGAACLLVYWLYSWLFRSPYYNTEYEDPYAYQSHGGGGYGLSWSTWFLVMGVAWKVPPMFPQVLGQYAQPWFGLSFTTFMYLFNMLTQGQRFGGGGGLGGLFGGGRRRGR